MASHGKGLPPAVRQAARGGGSALDSLGGEDHRGWLLPLFLLRRAAVDAEENAVAIF
jgi:hypothetical protein